MTIDVLKIKPGGRVKVGSTDSDWQYVVAVHPATAYEHLRFDIKSNLGSNMVQQYFCYYIVAHDPRTDEQCKLDDLREFAILAPIFTTFTSTDEITTRLHRLSRAVLDLTADLNTERKCRAEQATLAQQERERAAQAEGVARKYQSNIVAEALAATAARDQERAALARVASFEKKILDKDNAIANLGTMVHEQHEQAEAAQKAYADERVAHRKTLANIADALDIAASGVGGTPAKLDDVTFSIGLLRAQAASIGTYCSERNAAEGRAVKARDELTKLAARYEGMTLVAKRMENERDAAQAYARELEDQQALIPAVQELRAALWSEETERTHVGTRTWAQLIECVKDRVKYVNEYDKACTILRNENRSLLTERNAAFASRDEAIARLPWPTAKVTTIDCPKGHTRMHAANWIDHGCRWCEREALRAEADSAIERFNLADAARRDLVKIRHRLEAESAENANRCDALRKEGRAMLAEKDQRLRQALASADTLFEAPSALLNTDQLIARVLAMAAASLPSRFDYAGTERAAIWKALGRSEVQSVTHEALLEAVTAYVKTSKEATTGGAELSKRADAYRKDGAIAVARVNQLESNVRRAGGTLPDVPKLDANGWPVDKGAKLPSDQYDRRTKDLFAGMYDHMFDAFSYGLGHYAAPAFKRAAPTAKEYEIRVLPWSIGIDQGFQPSKTVATIGAGTMSDPIRIAPVVYAHGRGGDDVALFGRIAAAVPKGTEMFVVSTVVNPSPHSPAVDMTIELKGAQKIGGGK